MGFRPPPMPVETAPVVQTRVADRFEAVGTIEASEAITVVSESRSSTTPSSARKWRGPKRSATRHRAPTTG